MFISILLSFAAPVVWVLMIMKKNEYQAQISEISSEQDEIQKKFETLDRYESDLDKMIGSVEGTDEQNLNRKQIDTLRQTIVSNHPLLQNKDMPLSQLLISIAWQVRNKAQQLRPLRLQRRRVQNMLSHQQQRLERYGKSFDDYITMLSNHKNRLTADRGELKSTAQEIESRGEEKVSQIQSTMTEATREHNQKMQKLDNRIISLKNEIGKLLQQKTRFVTEQKPDGRILRSTPENDWAFIDIGSQDRVEPGIQFKVYRKGKGDQKIEKGRIEVKEVFPDYARCKIISLRSPSEPILKNDVILNPVFNTKEPTVYALAGDFGNRDRLVRLIEKAGATVRDTPSVEIDYLLITDGYKQDEAFEKVRTLGTPLIELEKIEPFLGE